MGSPRSDSSLPVLPSPVLLLAPLSCSCSSNSSAYEIIDSTCREEHPHPEPSGHVNVNEEEEEEVEEEGAAGEVEEGGIDVGEEKEEDEEEAVCTAAPLGPAPVLSQLLVPMLVLALLLSLEVAVVLVPSFLSIFINSW